MRYPCKSEQVKLFPDEYYPDEKVLLVNQITGDACEMSIDLVNMYIEMDGNTNPYELFYGKKRELNVILKKLKKMNMLKKKVYRSGFNFIVPIINLRKTKFPIRVCSIFEKIIRYFSFPVFILSSIYLYYSIYDLTYFTEKDLYIGVFIGLLFGIILHEISHMVSAITYGANVYEVGLIINLILSAYIAYDEDMIESIKGRFKTTIAGVLMNIFISGIFFCMASITNYVMFFVAGVINFSLACLNIICSDSFDGYYLMVLLLNEKSEIIEENITKYHMERIIRRKRINGCIEILAKLIFRLLKATIIIIGLSNVLLIVWILA